MARKRSEHYVNNKEFLYAIVAYKKDIREAEAAGFALFDQGAFRRYGAPVFRNGHLVGFLGLGGTSLTIPDDQLIEIGTILRRHADLLSEQLSSTQHA